MEGKDDPDNRRDFPGGFPGDRRNAFTASERSASQQRMWQWTRDWIKLRREHAAIRRGRLIDLFYDDDVYAYARQDRGETVIIAINRAAKEKTIKISAANINARNNAELKLLLGSGRSTTVMGGQLTLLIPGRTVVAYRI